MAGLERSIRITSYNVCYTKLLRTEKWTKDNCTVLTSDNKTRIDADGSFAQWCIVEGKSETKEGRSGILFLSHPSNRMHPEPMRVWPIDSNGGRITSYNVCYTKLLRLVIFIFTDPVFYGIIFC